MNKLNFFVSVVISLVLLVACSSSDDPTPTSPPSSTPVFSGFSPGTAFIGEEITISGGNFGTDPNKLSVTFGGVAATVMSVSNTSAKVVVPDDIEQSSVKIKLVLGDYSKTTANDFMLKGPVIESISPASGLPGQTVTVKGKGFRKSNKFEQLSFAGKLINAASVTAISNSELTLTIPSDATPGEYSISATIAGMAALAPEKFEVVGRPSFSAFSPETAFIGEEITITGENLGSDPDKLAVFFGSVQAEVLSVSNTTAKVIVPNDIEEASPKVKVVLGDYSQESTSNFKLKAPVIESISHTSGFSGQRITIKGKGFRNSYHFDQVKFGNTVIPKGSIIPPGNTELKFSVPDKMTAGKYSVSVTILGMTATSSEEFEVIIPTITSFTPDTGTEHTTVTIKGTNFIDINGGGLNQTSVVFSDKATNGLQSTVGTITSVAPTEIKVVVPVLVKDRPQGWLITVTVVSGTATAANVFTYTE